MSIFDKIKEPTGIELIDTMFDPYLRGKGRLADTIRGMGSGEETLKNLQKYNTPEKKLELQERKEKTVDLMLENQKPYMEKMMERQGVTDPYKLNIGSGYDSLMNQIENASDEAFAEQLTSDSRAEVLGKSAIMGVADATAFIVSMLDGPGGLLQYEKMVNAVHNNKYINLKNSINKENLADYLGKTVDQLTEQDLKEAGDKIYDLHRMSHLGFGLGTIAAFPAEDLIIRGVLKGLKAGGGFALRKSGDLASDIKYGDPTLSATLGRLKDPKGGVGANVVSKPESQYYIAPGAITERGYLKTNKSTLDELDDDHYQDILDLTVKNTGTPGGASKAVIDELGLAKTETNINSVSFHKREAINRGLTSKFDASTEYTKEFLETTPIKVIDYSRQSGVKTYKNTKDKTFDGSSANFPEFSLIEKDGTLIPDYYAVAEKGKRGDANVHLFNDPKYNKIFGDEANLNKFLEYLREYPNPRTISSKPDLMKKIADDLGYTVDELFGPPARHVTKTGEPSREMKGSVFNKARIVAQNLPKYDTEPSAIKKFLSKPEFSVTVKKGDKSPQVNNSWKNLSTDEILYYLKNSKEMTQTKISEKLKVRYQALTNLRQVIEKAQKESPEAFEKLIGSFERKLFEGVKANVSRELLTGTNAKLAKTQSESGVKEGRDVIGDIKKIESERGKPFEIMVDGEKQRLVPTGVSSTPKLHDQGAGLIGTRENPGAYGITFKDTMGAEQGFNILFTKSGKLRASQTSTQRANILQSPLEGKLKDLMDARQALISEGKSKGFNSVSQNSVLFPKTNKSIFKLLKDNQEALNKINKQMEELGVRTLMEIKQPNGKVKVKQFGELLSGMTEFVKKRKAGLLADGGRVRAFGDEGGAEKDLERKPIFDMSDFVNLKVDAAQERTAISEVPKSQRKQLAFFLQDPLEGQSRIEKERESDPGVRYKIIPKEDSISSVQQKIAAEMIDAKPTKFPLSSFPKLLTENALVKSLQRNMATGPLIFGQAANSILNSMGNDEKTFAERFPVLSGYLAKGFTPTPATPKEAAYIDGIDEINRAVETGFRNLGFNTMDLILGGIDLTGFGDGKLSERLRQNYEKTAKNDPETFMGDMVALLVEFGVPGGLVSKIVTRAQKALRLKGFNTMTRYVDDDVVGTARLAMNTSNIAKRMGTGAVIFGAADFVGGGPYSSLKRMFPEDATLLPGKPIDTTDLSGPELALANMKNRVRFGADGALIGGLFPLVGPPAWALTKGTLALPFKTLPGVNRSVFGGALQLAGVPLKIAADSLAGKIPYTNKTIPLVGEGISYLGKQGATAAQATAAFIGKQVFTRAALGLYDAAYARSGIYAGMRPNTTMFTKNLPKFEDWRRFSVNSRDPLHQYLAKIDNKLAMFRDIGKLGKDAFATKTQSDLYIRAKSRAVEKYLIDVERIAYKLAKGFEERHQKYGEFETIQKKYLDDVLDFLEGKIRIDQLPKQLQVPANDLRNYTNSLKKEFGELLPTTDPINYLLQADINSVMRRSFAAFTNNSYQPTKEAVRNAKEFIKNLIKDNNSLKMEAEMAFPDKSIAEAIDEFASLKVADIMHTARYEMSDPFKALENIAFRKLGLDDISLVTGDELPKAIRALLGEEKNLRSSLLQTTGNIIASTSQKKALDQIAQMGLANGWLFRSADEALGKGILNAAPLTDVKGSGFLLNDAIGLYGTPEIIKQLGGYSLFDGFLKSTIYQNILAAKAMVQGGKTLYSPATQMRNVGSAALFALNVGHIGGSASVPQAFKIVMDDIFGPGRNVDKKKLNKFIERKIELGVIDENVVAQELTAILNDLKGATKETGEPVISSFNQLIQRVGNTQLSQYVQRLYAGGDNLWKLYGHEFYISELKQFTKSIDDVQRYFKDIVGREFVEISPKTGGKKTVMEGIEEIAAHLVRDTYPTYSRVPPAIQAIRKLPIGNFISFPAEMLRTTATTLSTSLKHIASGNPGLQAMGYRSLFGQFSTLYGVNEGVKALGHTFTDVSPEAMRAYQDGLGPKFMENHLMVPLTNKDPDTGEFKAFDLSSYNPYAYVIDPVESFIRELGTTRMSVDEVEGEVYNRIFDAASPLMAFIEPFTSETILLEPMFDIWARQGRARNGATVFSPTDDFGDKVSKSFQHILGTVAPGFIRSSGQVLNALSLDTKQGRLSELSDVLIRLLGGSIINVDPISALDYKAIDIRDIRSNVYKTEHFFSKENALERGPDVMAAEFQKIQNEALAAQFEVYKMFNEALNTGLLTKKQIKDVLGKDGRNVPNLDNLIDGKFTPVSYSESGLRQRADELYDEYKKSGIIINRSDLRPFTELNRIIRQMKKIEFDDLLDPERNPLTPSQVPKEEIINPFLPAPTSEVNTPQLPNMPTPVVPNTDMNPVNPATGLTTTETALLSPGEQAIRQRQKGMA